MSIGHFYAAVGALMWNPAEGKYLVLKRTADKDFGAGVWECVTGRVDQGEGFTEALHREVREELGVEVQIDFMIDTMHFYRGEARPENELVGVVYRCSLEDAGAIQTSWEHSEHRWVTADEAGEIFPEGYWLVDLIQHAERIRALLPPELLAVYREGFE
ncbi:MAG: NUDIX domain-containing protein [Anaerolineae bacterium]|jgi:8-oxo-dGTP pyrophosphatase MutT (NUDIX family)